MVSEPLGGAIAPLPPGSAYGSILESFHSVSGHKEHLLGLCVNPRMAGGLSHLRTAGGGGHICAPPG